MSNVVKRWKVLDWPARPASTRPLMLCCPRCQTDQQLEVGHTPGGVIIAAMALTIVFDPPNYKPRDNFMPESIQCRNCRKIFSSEVTHVR
jgi:hypothetical protein